MKVLRSRFFVLAVLLAAALSARADDQVYTKVDQNPVPLKTPPPKYPELERRGHVSGLVLVSVTISESGDVLECAVSKSTAEAFTSPAVDAVKSWKFKPAVKDGSPVKVRIAIPVRFNMDE